LLASALLLACTERTATTPTSPSVGTKEDAHGIFIDRAGELGIDFQHDPVLGGELLMTEILGAGAALVDIDNDGDLDLLLIQSRPGADETSGGSKLYRNQLIESGELHFADITAESGLRTGCYGTGVAAADIDNDGLVDLYILCDGPNELWHNQGGRFVEIGVASGTADPAWSTSASFFDVDGDGLLDLYIGNYLDYPPATRRPCRTSAGIPDYCGPLTHPPAPDRLLRNLGGVRFADISAFSGIAASAHAPALGAVAADYNGDGRQDLYIANDALPNHLWINQGDGRFADQALLAGVAVNTDGQAEGSMGVDAGDYDGDGDDDLFMVHLADEKATLYAASGAGVFEDRSLASGLAALTRGHTGFGTAWIDVDHDGWLDLLIVNGRVRMDAKSAVGDEAFPYAQKMLLLRNQGSGQFADVSTRGGPAFALERVGRGAAFGDLDNDGDVDVVVNNANAAPFVLINQIGQDQGWLGVDLREYGRSAHGARAGLALSDGRVLWRRVRVDGSYASANDSRIQFGYPAELRPEGLTVVWADGSRSELSAPRLRPGSYTTLRRDEIDAHSQK
jgi:hypothetical protein